MGDSQTLDEQFFKDDGETSCSDSSSARIPLEKGTP